MSSLIQIFPLVSVAWNSWGKVLTAKVQRKRSLSTSVLSVSPVTPLMHAVKTPNFPSSYLCCWLSSRNPPCSLSPLSPIQFQKDFCFPNPIPECSEIIWGHLSLLPPLVYFLFMFQFSQELLDQPSRRSCPLCLAFSMSGRTMLDLGGGDPWKFTVPLLSSTTIQAGPQRGSNLLPWCPGLGFYLSCSFLAWPWLHHIAVSLQPLTFTSLTHSFFCLKVRVPRKHPSLSV